MEHPRRVVLHLGLLEIEIFRLIVSDPDLKTTVVVDVRATRGSARWPEKNRILRLYKGNYKYDMSLSIVAIIIVYLSVENW